MGITIAWLVDRRCLVLACTAAHFPDQLMPSQEYLQDLLSHVNQSIDIILDGRALPHLNYGCRALKLPVLRNPMIRHLVYVLPYRVSLFERIVLSYNLPRRPNAAIAKDMEEAAALLSALDETLPNVVQVLKNSPLEIVFGSQRDRRFDSTEVPPASPVLDTGLSLLNSSTSIADSNVDNAHLESLTLAEYNTRH